MMHRALISRGARLVQQASAESSLLARSAPAAVACSQHRPASSVTIPPPPSMLRPLQAPFRYLFGPGPSNVPPRVLAAGGRPIIGHLHPEMYEVKKDRLPHKIGLLLSSPLTFPLFSSNGLLARRGVGALSTCVSVRV